MTLDEIRRSVATSETIYDPKWYRRAIVMLLERDALVKFGLLVLETHREDGGCDLDGDWLQTVAEELGLLVSVRVTEPCSEDHCACAEYGDFPQECLRYSEAVNAMINAQKVKA